VAGGAWTAAEEPSVEGAPGAATPGTVVARGGPVGAAVCGGAAVAGEAAVAGASAVAGDQPVVAGEVVAVRAGVGGAVVVDAVFAGAMVVDGGGGPEAGGVRVVLGATAPADPLSGSRRRVGGSGAAAGSVTSTAVTAGPVGPSTGRVTLGGGGRRVAHADGAPATGPATTATPRTLPTTRRTSGTVMRSERDISEAARLAWAASARRVTTSR
jgi:hypothetical protein